jgi:predicted nucleotidyltransferase
MDLQPIVRLLKERLPGLMAVYAFGSRVANHGELTRA